MDKFINLLSDLKKNDKVTKNVINIIIESQKQNKEELSKAILNYYKDCINKECIREFLFELCKKDDFYLKFFQRYSKIFDDGQEGLSKLLNEEKKTKRIKVEEIKEKVDVPNTNTHSINLNFSTNLDNDYLNQSFDPFILYPPQQCKVCGLRYTEDNELYTIHIDDHFRKSRALEEKETFSREFFCTYESWIKNLEKVILNLKVDKVEKVVYRGTTVYCSICSNKIETVWDDEEDEFVLKECVRMGNGENKKFCHKACVT